MNKETLHKLERELRANGYTHCAVEETPGSYHWLKVFVKKDFNTNKDCVAFAIEYNITGNTHVDNDVDVSEPEVTVKIYNNFEKEIKTETEISKQYLSPKQAQLIAEKLWKFGNKHIITKKIIKYYWNMFKYWVLLHIDTILVAIACGVFFAVAITSKS